MVNKYKSAIIGLGRIGFLFQFDKKREQPASHSLALFKNKKIDLVAGCDINKERLKQWNSFYKKSRCYSSYIEMLEKENPDIVTISVDEKSHLELTLNTIERKPKLIILEKPVATNLKDALLIKDKATKYNVPILVNHPRRYSNHYIILKSLLKEQYIGEIHSVIFSLWSGMKVWKKDCDINGNCSLLHDGTHLIDIIYYLFEIDLLNPVIDNIIKDDKGEIESLFVHYEFQKSPYIIYVETSGNKKYFGFDIDIRGKDGRIIIGNGYFKVYKRKKSKLYSNFYSLEKKIDYSKKRLNYFSNMINNAVNFLDNKENLYSFLDDGIKDIEAIYKIVEKFNP